MKLKILLIVANIVLGFAVFAQEVTPEVTAEPDSGIPIDLGFSEVNAYFQTDVIETRLGEPIPVKLIVEMPSGYSIPEWTDNILDEPFQIVDSSEVETRQQGNLQIQEQELTVVAWKLDSITTDETFLIYQSPMGDQRRTPITSITINVTSTRAESDVTLRPLKSLIDLPYTPPYVYAVPIILVIVIVTFIRKIRFDRRVQEALSIPDSPVQHAVIELKHILDTNVPIEEAYPLIADEIRNYLTEEFRIRATDMTTMELMNALQTNPIFSNALRSSLRDLLEQADLVKFANHHPAVEPASVVEYAIHWMEQVERARIGYK